MGQCFIRGSWFDGEPSISTPFVLFHESEEAMGGAVAKAIKKVCDAQAAKEK